MRGEAGSGCDESGWGRGEGGGALGLSSLHLALQRLDLLVEFTQGVLRSCNLLLELRLL